MADLKSSSAGRLLLGQTGGRPPFRFDFTLYKPYEQLFKRSCICMESDMAKIKIKDNGPGISQETQSGIFKTFFTSKLVGTGLGPTVSYMIIPQIHSGDIMADSRPGAGACFTIRLPL